MNVVVLTKEILYDDLMATITYGSMPVYSNIENPVLWARSELDGSALEFCVSEYWSNGELEYWEKKKRL